MDIQFPQQKDPFRKTFLQALGACILAFAIGLFLGNALGAIFGTDESVISTSTYTDNMSAVKNVFADPDQLDSYMRSAEAFYRMDGLRLYAGKDRQGMLCRYQGQDSWSDDLFDDEVRRSLKELMNTDEALLGLETTAGDPIEGIALQNIAVQDAVVFYYLYYDEYGYIGIAYDHNKILGQTMAEYAMPIFQDAENVQGMWYIIYYLED